MNFEIYFMNFHKFSFWSAKSLNDIFKGDSPLLESDEGEGGGEAGDAGRDDGDGGDQQGWEGAGGQQQEGEGGDEEKGEEEVEDLGLSGLGQSIHHKLLQSVLIPFVQLVLGLHLLIVHLPLFLIVFLGVASLLLKDHIKHNLNSLVVAEAKIISWNPENDDVANLNRYRISKNRYECERAKEEKITCHSGEFLSTEVCNRPI